MYESVYDRFISSISYNIEVHPNYFTKTSEGAFNEVCFWKGFSKYAYKMSICVEKYSSIDKMNSIDRIKSNNKTKAIFCALFLE